MISVFFFLLLKIYSLTLFDDFLSSRSIAVGHVLPCADVSFMDDFRLSDGTNILSKFDVRSDPEMGFVSRTFVSRTSNVSMGSYFMMV